MCQKAKPRLARKTTNNTHALLHLRCMNWDCPDCRDNLRDEWAKHVRLLLADNRFLFRLSFAASDQRRIWKIIRGLNGEYIRLRDGNTFTVLTTAMIPGATRLRPAEAIQLAVALIATVSAKYQITTSQGWSKPRRIRNGRWELMRGHVSTDAVIQTASETPGTNIRKVHGILFLTNPTLSGDDWKAFVAKARRITRQTEEANLHSLNQNLPSQYGALPSAPSRQYSRPPSRASAS